MEFWKLFKQSFSYFLQNDRLIRLNQFAFYLEFQDK